MEIRGLEIEIIRKSKKNLSVKALPDGRLICSVPLGLSDAKIIEFITSKIEKIRKIQERALAREGVVLPTDKKELAKLKNELEIKIYNRLPYWENTLSLRCSSWGIKNMKSRWGSCNYKTGKIWFSLMLALKSEECLDYIIVHELTHLRHPNHGTEFKNFLTKHFPNWKAVRKQL